MQCVVSQHKSLVVDSPSDQQPVKGNKGGRDVLMVTFALLGESPNFTLSEASELNGMTNINRFITVDGVNIFP